MLTEALNDNTVKWTAAGVAPNLLFAAGAAVYTAWIPIFDSEQLGLGIQVSGGTSALVRLRFSADAGTAFDEQVESLGAVVNGAQRFSLQIKEWGPLAAGNYVLHRPSDFHFVAVGIYAAAGPGANDFVHLTVERQRGAQMQVSGG